MIFVYIAFILSPAILCSSKRLRREYYLPSIAFACVCFGLCGTFGPGDLPEIRFMIAFAAAFVVLILSLYIQWCETIKL
jgi:hypothetical protein